MRIALAQLDCRLGEVEANSERVRETISTAHARGAELVVFPELQLSGYAIGAIAHDASCSAVAAAAPASEAAALIGFLERDGDRRYNSAVYAVEHEPLHVHRKLFLVDYPPFEENRVFAEGTTMRAFDTPLGRMAVLICNDAWHPVLPAVAAYDGAQVLLVPSCSSTAVPEAEAYWRGLTRFYARMLECYVVFVNRVGAEAGFTYWGGSHIVDPWGEVVAEAPRNEEALVVADVDLDRVTARRVELPLPAGQRFDIVQAELARIAAATSTRGSP